MATFGETSYQGNGGVGGKFRVNSNRRDSKKPYSRPSVAIRNTSAEKQTSWRPRIVENASRIVTESAHKLFSSVFRKNLQAIPLNSEANDELGDAFPEEVPYDSENQEHVNDGRDGLNNNSSGDVLNDLEQILKQKTFTRVELDRLTELLRSRTSDVSAVNEQKRFETSASQLVDAGRKGSAPVPEKEVKIQTSLGPPSTSSGSFVDEDIASPTEIAKAYMGSRSSKLTPLTLGYRNQHFREDVLLQNGVANTPKPHIMSPVPRTSARYGSLPNGSEKDYLTPAPHGRYAIYSMARTPYSRVHHSAMLRTEGKAGPSLSSQRSLGKNLFSGGRQAFKRRSTELDSELGSVGPIRRIRRKTEMTSPLQSTGLPSASPSIPFVPIGSAASKRSISAVEKQLQLDEHSHNSVASKRFACVPNQSRDTAQKILEQLEKLAPSPKGKSCELKATGVTKTPSPKLMPGDNHYSSPRVDENIPTGISILKDDLGPKANGIIATLENDSQRKQTCEENGFQTTQPCEDHANKDSHKLEENSFSRQIESNPSVAGKVKHDRPAVENKENPSGAMTVGEPVATFSDISNPGSFLLKKTCDAETSNNLTASEKGRGGTFPDRNATTATVVEPGPSASPSPSLFNATSSSSESIPVKFSFPSKTLDKTTSESSDLNGANSEAKPKTMSSAATPSNEESDKAGNGGTAPVIFSFGGASTGSTHDNGSTTPAPPLFQFGSTTSSAPVTPAPPLFQFGSTTSTTSTAPSNGLFVFGSQPAPSPFPTSPGNDKMDVEDNNVIKTQAPKFSNNFAFPATIQTQSQSTGFGLSGGDDKSTRRIIKINRNKLRKR